jgi:dTDP-4-dehydrorhamnose 3,5-epimerase-like enzyme
MDYKIEHFEKFNDNRGQLVVFLRNRSLEKRFKEFGQIYFVTFDKKGVVRGNHYHKKWREWFGVVTGKLEVKLKDVKTGKIKELVLDGNSSKYVRLEVGPNIAHTFRNMSTKASLINYTNREWSPEDTFVCKLI